MPVQGESLSPIGNGETREVIGRIVGVGGSTVQAAMKVLKKGTPEQIAAVESGKESAYTVARQIDNPEPEEESGDATESTEAEAVE